METGRTAVVKHGVFSHTDAARYNGVRTKEPRQDARRGVSEATGGPSTSWTPKAGPRPRLVGGVTVPRAMVTRQPADRPLDNRTHGQRDRSRTDYGLEPHDELEPRLWPSLRPAPGELGGSSRPAADVGVSGLCLSPPRPRGPLPHDLAQSNALRRFALGKFEKGRLPRAWQGGQQTQA